MKFLLFAAALTGTLVAPVFAHHEYLGCEPAECDVPITSSLTSDQQLQAAQEPQQ